MISEQLCDYTIREAYYEDNKLVRSIFSSKNGHEYMNNQQCWASFKCPQGLHAYWRRRSFSTERHYDQVRFYGVKTDQYRIYSGDLGGSHTWHTLSDDEIIFEFKSDEDTTNGGFEFHLTCK